MRNRTQLLVAASLAAAAILSSPALASAQPGNATPDTARAAEAPPGPKRGDVVQTDTLGMNLASWNLDTHKTTTVANQAGLSEFVGAHYFFADRWRVGMNLQFTELLTTATPGADRFATFALLPQVGWHFYDPFFAAVVFTFAPRTAGGANLDMGLQGVLGAGLRLAEGVRLTAALEVPYNFYVHRTIGITPLVGLSIKL
ncbi:MAG TPA: hypothetical protein VE987_01215 [Polyangiaceae bacterium]|nr:hypothetical protein [Polyangiaceae bacterium]